MKSKSEKLTEHYFYQLKDAWRPWRASSKSDCLVIPICTKLRENADVLVIGASHSRFDTKRGKSLPSDVIAQRFAKNSPDQNTYVSHNHDFAKALRGMLHEITGRIFDPNDTLTRRVLGKWMGTNRCAIQFKQASEEHIIEAWKADKTCALCQNESDKIIREMVEATRPKFVFLMGRAAVAIFHDVFLGIEPFADSNSTKNADQLIKEWRECKITDLGAKSFASSTLIPLFNPSARDLGARKTENQKRLEDNRVPEELGWLTLED